MGIENPAEDPVGAQGFDSADTGQPSAEPVEMTTYFYMCPGDYVNYLNGHLLSFFVKTNVLVN